MGDISVEGPKQEAFASKEYWLSSDQAHPSHKYPTFVLLSATSDMQCLSIRKHFGYHRKQAKQACNLNIVWPSLSINEIGPRKRAFFSASSIAVEKFR